MVNLRLRIEDRMAHGILSIDTVSAEVWNSIEVLTTESFVRVTGYFPPIDDNGQNGDDVASEQLHVTDLAVIACASPVLSSHSANKQQDYLSKSGLEARLNNRVLDVRRAASGAIFKLHSGMCQLIVEFLCSKKFHWIHTPRIISATIGGDNEYFHLPYFRKDAWLAQSSQHHKQMALSMDMQRVFEIGPVFRAEAKSSKSSRHVTEVSSIAADVSRSSFSSDFCQLMVTVHSARHSHGFRT